MTIWKQNEEEKPFEIDLPNLLDRSKNLRKKNHSILFGLIENNFFFFSNRSFNARANPKCLEFLRFFL